MPTPNPPLPNSRAKRAAQACLVLVAAAGSLAAVGQYLEGDPASPPQHPPRAAVRVQLVWPDLLPVATGICVGDEQFREYHPRLDGLMELPDDCLGTTLRLLEVPSRREIGRAVLVGPATQQITVPRQP